MTDIFGQYKSQESRALQSIDSTKYPDTNKDLQANMQRLNTFVDYLAQYVGTMQKGVDQANMDVFQRGRDILSNFVILLGGGNIADIDFGDLQYFLPAIGALFGFDSDTPFPINLFHAAERFLLGYVVPLDSFLEVIENIIIGFLSFFGVNQEFLDALKDFLDEVAELFEGFSDIFEGFLGIFNAFGIDTNGLGPFADIWHVVTVLISGNPLGFIGSITDPVFSALAPWVHTLAQFVDWLDQIIRSFSGGLTDLTGILNFSSLFSSINFTGILDPIGAAGSIITNILNPAAAVASFSDALTPIVNFLFGGFMGLLNPGQQATATQVGQSAAGISLNVSTMSAQIAAIQAALAAENEELIVVTVDFEGAQADELAKFSTYGAGSAAFSDLVVNDGQIGVAANGNNGQSLRMLYTGVNHTAPVDNMTTQLVLGQMLIPATPGGGTASYLDMIVRAHQDVTVQTRVICRMYFNSFQLLSLNNGALSVIGSQNLLSTPQGIVKLQAGTDDGPRYFVVTINGTSYQFFDGSNVSAIGASFRERGFEFGNGTYVSFFIPFQNSTGSIAHFVATSLAA